MKIKEILVLHHSHLDLGYTHPQPVLWRLQYDFIEQALSLLEETELWPEVSKPKWTCEVTSQVTEWLKYADDRRVDIFRKYSTEGRIGLAGLQFNTTPLCNYEQLQYQLKPVISLREKFNAEIKAAIQHDVNGIPWSAGDLLLDYGIESLIMGINAHQGGSPLYRPLIFRWQTPSGRELRVMNGEHYTMFDQLFRTSMNDISQMEQGINEYLLRLEKQNYPHDFIYLTSTNIPVCWDNSPPNPEVANLIKQWNDAGKLPHIRYVIPDDLNRKIQSLKNLPLYTGDWTDYWNFGCASSAYETALNRGTKGRLFASDFLNAASGSEHPALTDVKAKAWNCVNIYDEHTWGNDESMDHDHPETRSQWNLKSTPAYEGRALSEYALVHELELLAGNPEQSQSYAGVLLVNPSQKTENIVFPVPEKWKQIGKKLATARYRYDEQINNCKVADNPLYSCVVEGLSWVKIPFGELGKYTASGACDNGELVIETITDMVSYDSLIRKEKKVSYIQSPFYKLTFNPESGRILSLYDRILNREIIDVDNEYGFFQLVREIPNPHYDGLRTSYYERDFLKMTANESCWKTDWKAIRETPGSLISCDISKTEGRITLKRCYKIPGMSEMEQTISLPADQKTVELHVTFIKDDFREPEAYYFVFPLNLKEGWQGFFDTAGTSVELDKEQLPGSCRDWVTVESYALIEDDECSVLLSTPDAPMIMFGDFNYGRKNNEITRKRTPLLLSWPMNNYWQTNFRASQPGKIEFDYALGTDHDIAAFICRTDSRNLPLLVHPMVDCEYFERGGFLQIDGEDVELLHMKRADDSNGTVVRLINHSMQKRSIRLSIPGRKIMNGWDCTPYEEHVEELEQKDGAVALSITGRKIVTIKLFTEE